MGWRGRGRPNLSRKAKFSGADEHREKTFPCSGDHEQDWEPHPVDPYSDENACHTISGDICR